MNAKRPGWGPLFPLAAVAIAGMAASHAVWSPTVSQQRELAAREAKLQGEVETLWRRNVHLERMRDGLQTDPLAIECVARLRLGYARPGEVAYAPARGRETVSFDLRPGPGAQDAAFDWHTAARAAIFPCLILLAAGLMLAAFFVNFSLDGETPPETFPSRG